MHEDPGAYDLVELAVLKRKPTTIRQKRTATSFGTCRAQTLDHFERAIDSGPLDVGRTPQGFGNPAVAAADFEDAVSLAKPQRFQNEPPVSFGLVSAVGVSRLAPALPKLRGPLEIRSIHRTQAADRKQRPQNTMGGCITLTSFSQAAESNQNLFKFGFENIKLIFLPNDRPASPPKFRAERFVEQQALQGLREPLGVA